MQVKEEPKAESEATSHLSQAYDTSSRHDILSETTPGGMGKSYGKILTSGENLVHVHLS